MCCRQRKLVPPPEIARCMSFNVQRTCISGVPFAVLPHELGATCSVGACDRGVLFNAALPETLPGHTEVLMFLQIVLHGCVCPSAEAVKDVAVDKKLEQGAGHGPWRGGRWSRAVGASPVRAVRLLAGRWVLVAPGVAALPLGSLPPT